MSKLTDQPSFQQLMESAKTYSFPSNQLTGEMLQKQCIQNGPLQFSYASAGVLDFLDVFQNLANEQGLLSRYRAILEGDVVNISENRSVQHHHCRNEKESFYTKEQARANDFATRVRNAALCSTSGKPFRHLVQIGIGGSELGPKLVCEALKSWVNAENSPVLDTHFIANIDPDHVVSVLDQVSIDEALFIVVSKSGTTLETKENWAFCQQYLKSKGWSDHQIKAQSVVVTCPNSLLDNTEKHAEIFYIDEAIGGRYSVTSVVGGLVLALAFGPDIVAHFLQGARLMDEAALEPDIRQNMTLLAALIGVWERTCLGYPAKIVVPYSDALRLFPSHLQQLDCESHGKHVTRDGEHVSYDTGPLVFGDSGTRLQHSMFQYIHQATTIVPVQFIGFRQSQSGASPEMQAQLNANLAAQMVALVKGQSHEDPNKSFDGGRPSTLIFADQLTPEVMGSLMAFYENMVMFQGFLWGLNSFDQEGVELGKSLTKTLLKEKTLSPNVLDLASDLLDSV